MNFKKALTAITLLALLSINPIYMLMNSVSSNPTLADNDGKNLISQNINKEEVSEFNTRYKHR